VALDCVALPPTLAESELFGHEKGAFTGADRQKPGKLEICGRGTVLLDEIGDMEPALQGKLLRVLEERTFERVGGLKSIPMNARVIAASHRDLAALVGEKRFRLDLYHRLMVFPIALPPLRSRGDDVVLLAEHFAAEFGARLGKKLGPLGTEVRQALAAYDFPGNVRELRNVIERAVILTPGRELTVEHLPARLFEDRPELAAAPTPSGSGALSIAFRPGTDTLDGLERRLLEEALRMAGGKKSRAAALLGISRFSLMRRVEKHRL
jgi:transcriptional regulator with GAF, ATPase, and Fis domain